MTTESQEVMRLLNKHGGAAYALTNLPLGYIFDNLSARAFTVLANALIAADAEHPDVRGDEWLAAVGRNIEEV